MEAKCCKEFDAGKELSWQRRNITSASQMRSHQRAWATTPRSPNKHSQWSEPLGVALQAQLGPQAWEPLGYLFHASLPSLSDCHVSGGGRQPSSFTDIRKEMSWLSLACFKAKFICLVVANKTYC